MSGVLRHKSSVDIKFIIIVGRNIKGSRFKRVLYHKGFAVENMSVSVLVAGPIHPFKLSVKDVAGR